MIVIGSMIGSGIFIVSADIARTVGSPGNLLLVWAITGAVTVIGALSYGELAGMMPHAGGQYVYLREAYNPLVGFLYGWTFFMVIQTGTIAAVGVAFAKFTSVIFPGLGESNILLAVGGLKISAAQMLAIAVIIGLTYRIEGRGGAECRIYLLNQRRALLDSSCWGFLWERMIPRSQRTGRRLIVDSCCGESSLTETAKHHRLLAAIRVARRLDHSFPAMHGTTSHSAGEVVEPRKTIPMSLATALISRYSICWQTWRIFSCCL
jgi:APA family basic amino acid/polyamine antiporter